MKKKTSVAQLKEEIAKLKEDLNSEKYSKDMWYSSYVAECEKNKELELKLQAVKTIIKTI